MSNTASDEMFKRLVAKRAQVEKERSELKEQRNAIYQLAKEDGREDLTEDEDREFNHLGSQLGVKNEELSALNERIDKMSEEIEQEQRLAKDALRVKRAIATATVTSEERTYVKGNGRSYLADLARTSLGMDGSGEARARLQRHAEEVTTDKEFRDLNRTDGTGGFHEMAAA